MDRLTILSPHLDDGVLSCGGRIWARVREGRPVRVVTLFAGPPPEILPPFAAEQHAKWGDPPAANLLRRAEDVAALARLGCEHYDHLDPPDSVYRVGERGEPLYGGEEAIFGAIHPDEARYAESLAALLERVLAPDETLLAPLGAGGHVDHQLARAAADRLRGSGRRVGYYAEQPYAEQGGAVRVALGEGDEWRVERLALPEAALAAKVAAAGYYRSQIPVLYGDDLSMSRRLRAVASAAAEGNGYAERLWWPREERA